VRALTTAEQVSYCARHMSAPRVSVIVVSWNAREHLIACLDRLAVQEPHELIVLDNGSTDGSLELLRERGDLQLIQLENPGFGAANNVGAKHARGTYLLLLNSDCELDDGALATLADFLDSDPRAGIVGPMLRFPDGRLQRSMGRGPSLLTELLQKTMLHRIFSYGSYSPRTYYADRTPDWVTAACMLVRSEVFAAVGGFDEHFFMLMEDLDLCKRVRDAGFADRGRALGAPLFSQASRSACGESPPLAERARGGGPLGGMAAHARQSPPARIGARTPQSVSVTTQAQPRSARSHGLMAEASTVWSSSTTTPLSSRCGGCRHGRQLRHGRRLPSPAHRSLRGHREHRSGAAPQAIGQPRQHREVIGVAHALERQQHGEIECDSQWYCDGQRVLE
jgi:N-acetylglucosaminyl-diphospho-decaprenol L-rhamnosyltransferase